MGALQSLAPLRAKIFTLEKSGSALLNVIALQPSKNSSPNLTIYPPITVRRLL